MYHLDWIPNFFSQFHWVDAALALLIAILFLVCRKLFARYIFSFLSRRFHYSQGISSWTKAFEKPLNNGFSFLGFYLALKYALPQSDELLLGLSHIFRSGLILLLGWGIYNVSAASSTLLELLSKRFGLDDSSMLIPFLSKTIRFVVILLVITIVGSEWGFSINGVVAGMGLGSLAIALAAKETLGNIIGGIVIIAEKPFSKGDWILTPSGEGVVEDISFRSTRIRTFADSVVTVPNSTLANHPITNWSKMRKRRVSFSLKVALDSDRERLSMALSRMERMLLEHAHVNPEMVMVRFDEFSEGSLSIFFYYFTNTTNWSEYLAIRQELNFSIMRILEEEGILLAYPAQRIFVEAEMLTSSGPNSQTG